MMDLASGFWRAQALFTAVELDLFSLLARKPATAADICASLGLRPGAGDDLLDSLAALGLLRRDGGRYTNSPTAARYLDRTQESYVGGFFLFMRHTLYPPWSRLPELIRTGERQEGRETFSEWYRDLDAACRFMDAMDSVSAPAALALAQRFD
ncbi:hypothetical protein Drose_26475 [Dactylosporangium roseum]|uniref:O-methyltransferase dimerisation domain-containing protein n=2 Tax=Dactylosporangium roseum TaxID=47989 RepID=A0ABY5Z0X6_9ACTN|nr:methyltransferase dimerization domain-containing protein [Dactylosporangium roseum]UWZ34738.1 hypothetical protein Drose_26475 [Dactylosporangium roseum]